MKSTLIKQEAKEIQAFIEKNKELPKICTINGNEYSIYSTSYLIAKLLDTKQSDIKPITVSAPSTTITTKINEQVTSPDYKDMIKRFVKYAEANKKVPAYVTTVKSKTKVEYKLFVYCMCKIINFYYKNSNTLPLYCVFNDADFKKSASTKKTTQKTTKTSTSTTKKATTKSKCSNPYTSSPHYTSNGCNRLGQCTGWWCGPHSIHQAIRKFGITKYTEKQIAGWAGTTTAGTGHSGLNTAIAKISNMSGKKLSVQWKNFSDMGANSAERFANIAKLICKNDVAIIWHIAYINGGNSTSGKHFGHYECIDKINTATKYVRALNSLGDKKSDGSYTGKLQDRLYDVQGYFARNTPGGQPALCIIKVIK